MDDPVISKINEALPFVREQVAALNRKLPGASALVTAKAQDSVNKNLQTLNVSSEPYEPGLVFRVYAGGSFYEKAFQSFDRDSITSGLKEFMAGVPADQGGTKLTQPEVRDQHFELEDGAGDADLGAVKDDIERDFARFMTPEQGLSNLTIGYFCRKVFKAFVSASGAMTQQCRFHNCQFVPFTATPRGTKYSFATEHSLRSYQESRLAPEAMEREIANVRALATAEIIQPGSYTVIASGDFSGIIAHESFGHGVEMDMFVKQRARAAEYMNRRVGSDLVNLVDDPTCRHNGFYFFDDEGVMARPVEIIRGGILVSGMTDQMSAMRLGATRTANGRRQDAFHKAYARMSNTFFQDGASRFEDMLASVEHGVYLEKSGSGMEDPKNWGIQCRCLLAREVKGGSFTGRIFENVAMTGFVPDILNSVSMVGDRMEFSSGLCGKGHKEHVPVSSGGPAMKMEARLS